MPRHTLYAYADGNDLHDVAANIESRLAHFLRTTPWRHAPPPTTPPYAVRDAAS